MIHSILKNTSPNEVKMMPFPHVVIDNALDEDLYEALEEEYPFETRIDGYSGYANNTRYQISGADSLRGERLSPLWQSFVKYHTSPEFLKDVTTLFSKAIEQYYPNLKEDMSVGVRFKDEHANIWMDCQPGINSPVKKQCSVKGPHLDHPNELYGGLLYFRHPDDDSEGGDLVVYKKSNPYAKYYGARFISESDVEEVTRIPYAKNRLVFFLHTIDSIHGVTERSVTPYTRRLANFIGEVEGVPLFNIPMQKTLKSRAKALLRKLR